MKHDLDRKCRLTILLCPSSFCCGPKACVCVQCSSLACKDFRSDFLDNTPHFVAPLQWNLCCIMESMWNLESASSCRKVSTAPLRGMIKHTGRWGSDCSVLSCCLRCPQSIAVFCFSVTCFSVVMIANCHGHGQPFPLCVGGVANDPARPELIA